jgi:hypothetical protein
MLIEENNDPFYDSIEWIGMVFEQWSAIPYAYLNTKENYFLSGVRRFSQGCVNFSRGA